MESLDILILGVEASIALAGFSGIIATFQFRGKNDTRRGDAVGLTMVLQFSLLSALVCSFAIILISFGLEKTTIWAACSLVVACIQTYYIFDVYKKIRGVKKTKNLERVAMIVQTPSVFLIIMNFMNASNIYFQREAGPVISSIVLALCIAGFMFSRLLLRPIWRNVRAQEAAGRADTTLA
jgi:hypothetical protein